MSDETAKGAATPDEDELRGLLDRARHGDRDALPALRRALDRRPGVWRAYGDLAAIARDAWVELASGPDLALREALARRAAEVEAEAAGSSPSPLESLLAGRVAACWLQAHYADAMAARVDGASVGQAEHARRRQDSAHRRFISAIGALAMVRKLLARVVDPSSVTMPIVPPPGLRVAVPGSEGANRIGDRAEAPAG